MSLRFRKSVKIAPGVKVNFNKNSISTTLGTKGAHHTISSSGRKTSTVGIPGTGISYSSTSSSGNSRTSKSDSSKGTASGCSGCLTVFFGSCLAIVVLGFILNYAWIPGIIAAIYFAKKTEDSKQKKIYVCVSSVISIVSFIIFLITISQPNLTALTVNWDKHEYDINEKVVLDIIVEEEGADIYSFEISDNDIARVKYIDDIATVHFVDEGTVDISFIANGDIQSNTTTITVIDKEAEEQRQQEAEEQNKQEETIETKEPIVQEPEKQETMVYVTNSGSKYHKSNCRHLKESKIEISLSNAIKNYEPCGTCKPPTQ